VHSDNDAVIQSQNLYKVALEDWIAAIRQEEELASSTRSIAQVDRWERAHYREDWARTRAKAAKKEFEAALRSKYFQF
jgi:hypothetical protein